MTDDMKIMHPELAAFYDLHRQSTAEHKTTAHAQIAVVLRIAHAGQRHVMALEQGLGEALLAPHDHEIDHNLNSLRARIRSAAEALTGLSRAQQDVAAKLVELHDAFRMSTMGMHQLGYAVPAPTGDTGAAPALPVV